MGHLHDPIVIANSAITPLPSGIMGAGSKRKRGDVQNSIDHHQLLGNLEDMIIPWVQIRWISDDKGYGLFATQDIPKGTITFVQDGLDIVIPGAELESVNPKLRVYVEKYSYEDFLGNRIISWDLGKYMNHDDKANTLSTGYGFEIAIRDIKAGEEVTDDYRIFSTHHNTSTWHMDDKQIVIEYPKELESQWDEKVMSALLAIEKVEQPLVEFIDDDTLRAARSIAIAPENYKPVKQAFPLKYRTHMEGLKSEY